MVFLARYSALLARPHLRRALVASVIGRLPIGITGLSILLLGQAASGSFVRGGAASAAYVIGLASVAPLVGRIIDRAGPRGVLIGSAFAFPAALAFLVLAVQGEASPVLTYALAFAAGASFPPITVCMRTFFRRELGEESMLAVAYSLESVLIETHGDAPRIGKVRFIDQRLHLDQQGPCAFPRDHDHAARHLLLVL